MSFAICGMTKQTPPLTNCQRGLRNKRRPMSIMKEALADTLICQVFKAVEPDGTMGLAFQSGKPVMTGLPEKAGPANRQKGLEIS